MYFYILEIEKGGLKYPITIKKTITPYQIIFDSFCAVVDKEGGKVSIYYYQFLNGQVTLQNKNTYGNSIRIINASVKAFS